MNSNVQDSDYLSIVPNPSNNQIEIILNQGADHIIITNSFGSILKFVNLEADQNQIVIDISNLTQGVYYIVAGNFGVKKFIKI